MSDHTDDEEEDRRILEERTGRYTDFMIENGVDVYYSEPTPDVDDYVERYLRDPPLHLLSVDEETRTEFAVEAFLAAYSSRMGRVASATVWQSSITSLATRRTMIDALAKHIPDSDLGRWLAESRRELARYYYLEYLWSEPWSSLIEAEFPGPELTLADFEEFESEREDYEREKEELDRKFEAVRDELETFLFEHGFVCDAKDRFRLMLAAKSLIVHQEMKPSPFTEADRAALPFGQASSLQESEAWQAMLDHYFPIPE